MLSFDSIKSSLFCAYPKLLVLTASLRESFFSASARVSRVPFQKHLHTCIYVSFTKFPQLLKGSFRDDIAFRLKFIFIDAMHLSSLPAGWQCHSILL